MSLSICWLLSEILYEGNDYEDAVAESMAAIALGKGSYTVRTYCLPTDKYNLIEDMNKWADENFTERIREKLRELKS